MNVPQLSPLAGRRTRTSFGIFRRLMIALLLPAPALAACRDRESSSASLTTAPKPGSIPIYAGAPPDKDIKPAKSKPRRAPKSSGPKGSLNVNAMASLLT